MIGLDRARGYAPADVLHAWESRGHRTARIAQVDAESVARRLEAGSVHVIDVRSQAEWQAGHIPGAQHIPMGDLFGPTRTDPGGRRVVVHCQGGARSAIAASVLQAQGMTDVLNLAGGLDEWRASGHRVEEEAAETLVSLR